MAPHWTLYAQSLQASSMQMLRAMPDCTAPAKGWAHTPSMQATALRSSRAKPEMLNHNLVACAENGHRSISPNVKQAMQAKGSAVLVPTSEAAQHLQRELRCEALHGLLTPLGICCCCVQLIAQSAKLKNSAWPEAQHAQAGCSSNRRARPQLCHPAGLRQSLLT